VITGSGGRCLPGDDASSDVQAVFSWSYQALTPGAARLFRLLGLHPGPDLSAAAAASLAGLPIDTVRPVLAELTRASLLVEHVPDRHSFHDLLRAYAADLAQRIDTDRHIATHRMLDHYLHTAYTAERLLYPARDPITLIPPAPGVTPQHPAGYQQALDWFTVERPVLLAAVDHAAATGFDTNTWQLAWTLATFLYRRGHWHDWATTGRAAVAAAQRLADPTAQARAHRSLAHAYTRLGRFDDAHTHLNHTLDLATQTGDQTLQARAHIRLGALWEQRGDYPLALEHAQHALTAYHATGHWYGQARALNDVGWYHALLGNHHQALNRCQQALTLHQDLDDRVGQAHTWDTLGYAHHHLGNHTQEGWRVPAPSRRPLSNGSLSSREATSKCGHMRWSKGSTRMALPGSSSVARVSSYAARGMARDPRFRVDAIHNSGIVHAEITIPPPSSAASSAASAGSESLSGCARYQ
jgi:tetratricopeptide (TPR) repeat protein